MAELVRIAREKGIARLSLETGRSEAFAPAIAFYKRRGFEAGGPSRIMRTAPTTNAIISTSNILAGVSTLQSSSRITSSTASESPSSALILPTVASFSARRMFSIFIASTVASG